MIIGAFKKMLPLLLAGVIAGCGGGEDSESASQKEQAEPQSTADYVEQATFTSLDGDTVSVADFKGKVVMIDLWETWCKPCLASFPTLQKLQEEYTDDFVLLAVTPGFTDTKEDARAFAEEHDYDFTYLMDSNGLHEKVGVQGIPFKLYVDAEGNFIQKSMGSYGPDQDYEKVKEIIEKHKKSDGAKSET
ncbi:TlpA family protein disulfide reductase [Fodinibius sp.]|uniref:TlpA family protein disulfide reductase n=1 Tax=Fodinibius sp. TaxID=1872440 RepID=UPI0035679A77